MERNIFAVTLLAAVFLSLVQISVQQGMIHYQQHQPPILITSPLCGPGWERDPRESGKCRAWCDSGCKNGYCKAPNTCECYPGFVMSLSGDCIEVCPMSCLNGYCDVITNACVCNTGYTLDNSGLFCVPKCSAGCNYPLNCTSPGHCACPQDQHNAQTNVCNFKCDPPCGNGRCVEHGRCECTNGYKLVDGTCQTDCSRPCVHGRCVAPDVCACYKKWVFNDTTHACQPICHGCENGECVAPDRCICSPGYKKVDKKCVPHCSKCYSHSGTCVAPEKCQCFEKYDSIENGSSCKKRKELLRKIISKIAHSDNEAGTKVIAGQYESQPVYNPQLYAGQQPGYNQPMYPNQQPVYNQPMYGQQNQQPLYPVQQQPLYNQPPQNQQPLYNSPVYAQSHNFTSG